MIDLVGVVAFGCVAAYCLDPCMVAGIRCRFDVLILVWAYFYRVKTGNVTCYNRSPFKRAD
jgi:hypothetical protein